MDLQEFFDYKNQLMKDILTTDSIVKLIDDTVGTGVSAADALAYKRVFPYEYIPETVQEGVTYVCFDVDIQESLKKPYYSPTIYVWVFTHRSKLRLAEGGVRTDKLCAEICKKINGSMYYGLGELSLYSCKRFAPMTDFNGKMMTFRADDISHTHDHGKDIPANRRLGI